MTSVDCLELNLDKRFDNEELVKPKDLPSYIEKGWSIRCSISYPSYRKDFGVITVTRFLVGKNDLDAAPVPVPEFKFADNRPQHSAKFDDSEEPELPTREVFEDDEDDFEYEEEDAYVDDEPVQPKRSSQAAIRDKLFRFKDAMEPGAERDEAPPKITESTWSTPPIEFEDDDEDFDEEDEPTEGLFGNKPITPPVLQKKSVPKKTSPPTSKSISQRIAVNKRRAKRQTKRRSPARK
jgi:hypothetical protein